MTIVFITLRLFNCTNKKIVKHIWLVFWYISNDNYPSIRASTPQNGAPHKKGKTQHTSHGKTPKNTSSVRDSITAKLLHSYKFSIKLIYDRTRYAQASFTREGDTPRGAEPNTQIYL